MTTAEIEERDVEAKHAALTRRLAMLAEVEEAERQRASLAPRPRPQITWESAPGGFTAESSFHGALVDLLEGVGVISVLPGVVDVPGLDGGPSLLEADWQDLVGALSVAGWEPACGCGGCDESPWCEPLVIGDRYVLRPMP